MDIWAYVHMYPFVHYYIYTLLYMYIWRYIHYSIPTYVVMYITTNAHMYICTYGHYIIPLYVGYSIPSFVPPVLLYPYPPIPPLNRFSEPCRAYVDLPLIPLMVSIVFFCRGAGWKPLISFTCRVYP